MEFLTSLPFTTSVFLGWILSVCLHEFGHAMTAYWGGDHSVKEKGYLTLNPLAYTNPSTTLFFPLLILVMGGIPLPGAAVYINIGRLRNRAWRSLVSAAGPLMSALCALGFALILFLGLSEEQSLALNELVRFQGPILTHPTYQANWFWIVLGFLVWLQIWSLILNLLPVPPLDGFGIIEPWLPIQLRKRLQPIRRYGILIILGLLFFVDPVQELFVSVSFGLSSGLVPVSTLYLGSQLFGRYALFLAPIIIVGLILYQRLMPASTPQKDKSISLDPETALSVLDQLLEADPQQAQNWYQKSVVLSQLKRNSEALIAAAKATELDPTHLEAWVLQGELLNRSAEYKQALKILDKALEIDPSSTKGLYLRSSALYYLEHYQQSLETIGLYLDQVPNDANALYLKACCYSALNDLPPALQTLDLIIKHNNSNNPMHVNALILSSNLLNRAENYEQALTIVDQALAIDPTSSGAWFARSAALFYLKRYHDSLEATDHYLKLVPHDANAYYNQACSYCQLGDLVQAQQALDQALAIGDQALREQAATDPDLGPLSNRSESETSRG